MAATDSRGYQVTAGTVHDAGQAALRIGATITALANNVGPASDMPPEPAGLQVGSTMLGIAPMWEQHLRAVGAAVQQTGQTLCQVSANYSNTEAAINQSFHAILA